MLTIPVIRKFKIIRMVSDNTLGISLKMDKDYPKDNNIPHLYVILKRNKVSLYNNNKYKNLMIQQF
jgi:hypothetical protein